MIICAAVWCSYYSWTEALKLRTKSLAAVGIPEIVYKAWELLLSKGLWFITVPVVFHQP